MCHNLSKVTFFGLRLTVANYVFMSLSYCNYLAIACFYYYYNNTITTKRIYIDIIQKLKSIEASLFAVNNRKVKDLDEILEHMRSLSKEDRKLIGKPLQK